LSGSWSPDGSRFMFVAKPSGDANYSVFVMNIDGTNLQRLTTAVAYNDFNLDWSQDGAWVVFTSTRSGSSDVWAMTADGANVTRVTTSSNLGWDPRWKRAAPAP
jgi:TolB protein